MQTSLPLFNFPDNTMAIYQDRQINTEEFLSHVGLVKQILPSHQYAINLCDNRYHFLVAFAACVLCKQVSLLPNSKAKKELTRLSKNYADSYIIDDAMIRKNCALACVNTPIIDVPMIDAQQVVAILFTSGTTGIPQGNHKTWGQLNHSARRVGKRFWPNGAQIYCLVATVPPQHMFGFETTVIFPLVLGLSIDDGHHFYPIDIQKTCLNTTDAKILITTPLHLKACAGLKDSWTYIDSVICATSPLTKEIATQAEQVLNTNVYEIYGCSESGAIATRQTSQTDQWLLLEDYRINKQYEKTLLDAPEYGGLINLPDQIEQIDLSRFYLLGRDSDLIKVGGKRESLAGLSSKLKTIDDIEDGVFFAPKIREGKRVRLCIIVVSKQRNPQILIDKLIQLIDPVFLPRPIIFVTKLPYNSIGKLKLSDLMQIFEQHSAKTIL